MVQITGYHVTSPDREESIVIKGLLPHKPSEDGNYQTHWSLDEQPRGVYVTLVRPALHWCYDAGSEDPLIIKVDLTGLSFRSDPVLAGFANVVEKRIGPERFLDIMGEDEYTATPDAYLLHTFG